MTPDQFRIKHPEIFLIDPGDSDGIGSYLHARHLIAPTTRVTTVSRAGDGNMNCTVRVTTTAGSLILKQARPWVEKYPQIAAPWVRIEREAKFYQLVGSRPSLAALMPAVLGFDAASRILALEDLGTAGDCSDVYCGSQISPAEISALAGFLSELHGSFLGDSIAHSLPNREMRELNHAHIFSIPLATGNGLNLDSVTAGLGNAAGALKADAAFCDEVARLGRDIYLADGPCLLHGDFFPGSINRTPRGPRIIDPEFGFFGRPEFDVGVFLAHLLLARQPEPVLAQWWLGYRPCVAFDRGVALQLAGVEIMRRLIGYAQLPRLNASLDEKRALLETARDLVLAPESHRLRSLSST